MRLNPLLPVVTLLLGGCALFTPKIKEPILLPREPSVAFRYEYDSVLLRAPYTVEDVQPYAIDFAIACRDDPGSTLISRDFLPGEELQLVLPQNVLSTAPLGNLALIRPQGGDFEPLEIFFTAADLPVVTLTPVLIRLRPYVVTGNVLRRRDDQPVAAAQVDLMARGRNTSYGSQPTDSLGFFRFEVKDSYGAANDFYLRIETGREFPTRVVPVAFDSTKEFRADIRLGLSAAAAEAGVTYQVRRDGTPFRAGPENGADIRFFLAAGDILLVTQVAGNRLYGFVEIAAGNERSVQPVYGWVDERDVELRP